MCLGIPCQVAKLNRAENWAIIEGFGIQKKIDITLVDDEISVGDYLIVHAGYAIGKINVKEAQKTLKLWEEIILAGHTD